MYNWYIIWRINRPKISNYIFENNHINSIVTRTMYKLFGMIYLLSIILGCLAFNQENIEIAGYIDVKMFDLFFYKLITLCLLNTLFYPFPKEIKIIPRIYIKLHEKEESYQ